MMRICLLFVSLFCIHTASAGPIASLRLDNGVVVRSEILYVDDNFYYCRKVTNPDEKFTVEVGKVPQSLRRRIQYLVEKGELTAPEETQKAVSVDKKDASGKWEFRDIQEDGVYVRYIVLSGRANRPVAPRLFFRFHKKNYEAFITFNQKVVSIIQWQVSYQVDDEPEIIEIWRTAESGNSAFSQRPFFLRDQLKGKRLMHFSAMDYKQQPIDLLFDLEGFDEALAQFEEALDL